MKLKSLKKKIVKKIFEKLGFRSHPNPPQIPISPIFSPTLSIQSRHQEDKSSSLENIPDNLISTFSMSKENSLNNSLSQKRKSHEESQEPYKFPKIESYISEVSNEESYESEGEDEKLGTEEHDITLLQELNKQIHKNKN